MEGLQCSICGGGAFREGKVLWPELVAEWQLSEEERAYVDRQQGTACTVCNSNLRVIALGRAIMSAARIDLPLNEAIGAGLLADWRVLDCNGAEGISVALSALPHYLRADFPEYDLRQLPFADGSFDLVIHSDTLEHVEYPQVALEECRRILAPGGRLCFIVPTIVGRLTRSRAGLAPSYHGEPGDGRDDFIVHTEFGADIWTIVHRAGFANLSMHQVDFPSAIAISAWDEPAVRKAQSLPPEPAPVERLEPVEPAEPVMPATFVDSVYDQDGLQSVHNHEFMADPVFMAAYARGVQAAGTDYQ